MKNKDKRNRIKRFLNVWSPSQLIRRLGQENPMPSSENWPVKTQDQREYVNYKKFNFSEGLRNQIPLFGRDKKTNLKHNWLIARAWLQYYPSTFFAERNELFQELTLLSKKSNRIRSLKEDYMVTLNLILKVKMKNEAK